MWWPWRGFIGPLFVHLLVTVIYCYCFVFQVGLKGYLDQNDLEFLISLSPIPKYGGCSLSLHDWLPEFLFLLVSWAKRNSRLRTRCKLTCVVFPTEFLLWALLFQVHSKYPLMRNSCFISLQLWEHRVWVPWGVCARVCGSHGSTLLSPSIALHPRFWEPLPLDLELKDSAELTGHQAPGICRSLALGAVPGCRGSGPGFLCLHNGHLTN